MYSTLKYFKKYYNNKDKNKVKVTTDVGFYDWLLQNTDYINDINLLNKIYDMFDLSNANEKIRMFENIKIVNGPIIYSAMRKILKEDGFLFPNKL